MDPTTDDRVTSDQREPQLPIWSTHDPACDQCRSKKQRCERQRPVCSNCKRLNLVCEYSGRGKKPNQNTELMRRLRRAEGRINSLETSLSRIQPYLDRFEAEPVLFNLPTAGELSLPCTPHLELDSYEWSPSSPEIAHELSEERGSIACLAMTCTRIAVAKYGELHQMSGPLAELTSLLRQVSELQEQPEDGIDRRTTVIRPPLSILQAMAPTYFDMLNESFPMFSRSSIEEVMKHPDDSASDSQDVASSLCFNNIILLTLMTKVRRHLAQDVPATLDSELLKTFVGNALGAFGDLDTLLHPKLVNVQALLSLSLVCQSMCLTDLARKCIRLANTLWRSLDLQSSSQRYSKRPVIAEAINVFWCIFILETAVPMSASERLPSSAVAEMPLPPEELGNHGRKHFLAAIRIARLRHNMLVAGTAFQAAHTTQGLAMRHCEDLQKLQSTLGIDVAGPLVLRPIPNDFERWTVLGCFITGLMINESFPGSQSNEFVISTARNAMLILLSIGMDTGELVEDQLFSTESIAAISALASNIIQHPNATGDVELLMSFHQYLKRFNRISPHTTPATRLEASLSAVIDFVNVVRLRPDSCPSTDPTLGPGDIDFTLLDIDQML